MIARAESGQARDNMTEFDAAEIARDVGELYEPLAEEKGLALKVEAPAPAPVNGNRELVSQALANLVDNAIKYAGAATASEANGAAAEIVVTARARGRPHPAHRSPTAAPAFRRPTARRVVERFVRLEQSRSQPGSGLGLSLAAAVARLHGGELTLEDNEPGLQTVHRSAARRPGRAAGLRRRARRMSRRRDHRRRMRRRRLALARRVPLPRRSRRGGRAHARRTGSASWADDRRRGAQAAARRPSDCARTLLAGLAESSPYLWELAQRRSGSGSLRASAVRS